MEDHDSRTATVGQKRIRDDEQTALTHVSSNGSESLDPSLKRRRIDHDVTYVIDDSSEEDVDSGEILSDQDSVQDAIQLDEERKKPSETGESNEKLNSANADAERICVTPAVPLIGSGRAILLAFTTKKANKKEKQRMVSNDGSDLLEFVGTKLYADLEAISLLQHNKSKWIDPRHPGTAVGPQLVLGYATPTAALSALSIANGHEIKIYGSRRKGLFSCQSIVAVHMTGVGNNSLPRQIKQSKASLSHADFVKAFVVAKLGNIEPSQQNGSSVGEAQRKLNSTDSHVERNISNSISRVLMVDVSVEQHEHSIIEDGPNHVQVSESNGMIHPPQHAVVNIAANTEQFGVVNGKLNNVSIPTLASDVQMRLKHLSSHDRELQSRYWGITSDESLVLCPMCSSEGHMSEQCPARSCNHCGAVDTHFDGACPNFRKCRKCRERGHEALDCPSKLARSVVDGFSCGTCGDPHPEEQCSWIWRTFNPDKETSLRKVDKLIVSCYYCGMSGHWGDDCKMKPKKLMPMSNIFSAQFASKFLSTSAASRHQPGLSIRGKAQSNQTRDSDSSSDATSFYGKKINTHPQPKQNIHVATYNFRAGNPGTDHRMPPPPPPPPHGNMGNYSVGPLREIRGHQYRGYHAVPPPPPATPAESYNAPPNRRHETGVYRGEGRNGGHGSYNEYSQNGRHGGVQQDRGRGGGRGRGRGRGRGG